MKTLLFAMAGAVLAAAPSIRVEPEVITACRGGFGQATIVWNGEGASPVTLAAGGMAMSGPEATTGSAQTGLWVTDGMEFTLRNAAGETLASAVAKVQCDAGGWWPLRVGNAWHFRADSRSLTGGHAVWRVARMEEVNGVQWAVLDPGPGGVTRLRVDDDGRILRLAADGREGVLIDPSGLSAEAAWRVTGRKAPAVTLAGTFGDELSWQGPVAGLGQESGRLARGVGPTYYQTNIIAGSSGGFASGLTLLEAVVGGARFVPNYPRVELSLETQKADITGKKVRNCAIPCYFTACFGADLPSTYKPCMEASVRGGTGTLQLTDAAGTVVYEAPADGWVRIPLYREPATVLPAGAYQVRVTVNGTTVSLPLEVQ